MVSTKIGGGGRQLDRRRARGVLNTCARESKAWTGRFLRENLTSDYGLFSFYEGQQGAATGQKSWTFLGMHRALNGWMLARAPALRAQGFHHTMDLGISYFPYSCMMCGLEKLGLVDQN